VRLHSHYARLHEHYVRLHRITHGCTCIMQPCGAATQGCIAAMWCKRKACLLMIFVFHSATNASSTWRSRSTPRHIPTHPAMQRSQLAD
jgi:hypothetical protein